MLKGQTKSGFEFNIDENELDDWELVENLVEIDEGNNHKVVKVAPKLLGEEQYKKFVEHCRNEKGKVPFSKMTEEIGEIFAILDEAKKSYSSQE